MHLILHPILQNFIQLPLLPKYKQNPELYYKALINISIQLTTFNTTQLARCDREKWKELSKEYLGLDNYQSNIYYDTWSTIAKLVVQNKNLAAAEEEIKKSNKSLTGGSSNTINSINENKSKLKKKKSSNSSLSIDSSININKNMVEFDRNNFIWGWHFFLTFLFYQLIEVKEENHNEDVDLYIEINDNLENPHFDYNDNLKFWAKNLTKYLFLMNISHDKNNHDIRERIFDENGEFVESYESKIAIYALSANNCKAIDLVFLRIKESKNSVVLNKPMYDQNERDPVDYSKYGKLEQFLPCYNTSMASLAMIQNMTKVKEKPIEYLKIKEIQKWIIDKLVDTTQQFNNLYDKLDPFKPTPLISIKLLPIIELMCSEGGVIRGTFPPAFYMKESAKHSVNRHVILRNQTKKIIYIPPEYIENMHLHLQNLNHCEIYILTTVKSITVTNSHHCKCIFGCISSRLTLNTVQDIKFSACTEQATFEKCQDITAYLYIKKPSLVIGKDIHSLFVAPINSWYKDINKHIKQAQIQLSNGQKNQWNSLRLVWFDKDKIDQAVNEQCETVQSPKLNATISMPGNSKSREDDDDKDDEDDEEDNKEPEINIYHKMEKVLKIRKSDERLQEKIQKMFILPSEFYELFVIPIFNKKKKSSSRLNLKTYSINNLNNLEYDENYQHSSSIMTMETSSKSNHTNNNSSDQEDEVNRNTDANTDTEAESNSNAYAENDGEDKTDADFYPDINKKTDNIGTMPLINKKLEKEQSWSSKRSRSSIKIPKLNSEKSKGSITSKIKESSSSELPSIERKSKRHDDSKKSIYNKNILNKLPTEYYKSVMHNHEGHCIVHRILSDKSLMLHDKLDSNKESNNNDDDDNDNDEYNNRYKEDNYEESTEKISNIKDTEEDINALVRNDF